ncbi:MAG: hypothetical protein V1874_11750 [Spirochaetota bacterium]
MRKNYILSKINKIAFCAVMLFVLLFYSNAIGRQIDYFNKPQVGIWFGVLTPLYTTYDQLHTSLGGGGFLRLFTPVDNLKIGLDSSYQYYTSKKTDGVNTLTLVPVYGNLLYRIPLPAKIPLIFQLKAGAGGSWVKIRPDRESQWDPMGMVGFEGSFAAGRTINIGFRIDYLLIYEKYIEGAKRNGHVLNSGITLYFNI